MDLDEATSRPLLPEGPPGPASPPSASIAGAALVPVHSAWTAPDGSRSVTASPDLTAIVAVPRSVFDQGFHIEDPAELLSVEVMFFASAREDGTPDGLLGRFGCGPEVRECGLEIGSAGVLAQIDPPPDCQFVILQAIYPGYNDARYDGPNMVSWGLRIAG